MVLHNPSPSCNDAPTMNTMHESPVCSSIWNTYSLLAGDQKRGQEQRHNQENPAGFPLDGHTKKKKELRRRKEKFHTYLMCARRSWRRRRVLSIRFEEDEILSRPFVIGERKWEERERVSAL